MRMLTIQLSPSPLTFAQSPKSIAQPPAWTSRRLAKTRFVGGTAAATIPEPPALQKMPANIVEAKRRRLGCRIRLPPTSSISRTLRVMVARILIRRRKRDEERFGERRGHDR